MKYERESFPKYTKDGDFLAWVIFYTAQFDRVNRFFWGDILQTAYRLNRLIIDATILQWKHKTVAISLSKEHSISATNITHGNVFFFFANYEKLKRIQNVSQNERSTLSLLSLCTQKTIYLFDSKALAFVKTISKKSSINKSLFFVRLCTNRHTQEQHVHFRSNKTEAK